MAQYRRNRDQLPSGEITPFSKKHTMDAVVLEGEVRRQALGHAQVISCKTCNQTTALYWRNDPCLLMYSPQYRTVSPRGCVL